MAAWSASWVVSASEVCNSDGPLPLERLALRAGSEVPVGLVRILTRFGGRGENRIGHAIATAILIGCKLRGRKIWAHADGPEAGAVRRIATRIEYAVELAEGCAVLIRLARNLCHAAVD